MGAPRLRELTDITLRAHPAYELVPFERISEEEQAALGGLREDPELHGVLRPGQGTGLSVKSVGRDTARHFLALQEPGPVPREGREHLGKDWGEQLARLVVEGVLQLQHAGTFVCGAEAHPVLFEEAGQAEPRGPVARLSLEALHHVQRLGLDSVTELATRLYLSNTVPFSPRWARALPDDTAVARFLGLSPGGAPRRMLEREWEEAGAGGPWRSWSSRAVSLPSREGRRTWKLYVSPLPESLPEAFAATVRVLTETGTPAFKVGRDVRGLLRPDKLVAYFTEREEMEHVGRRLRGELGALPAQGVPFTGGLLGDALVSFGADPPPEHYTVSWLPDESWRAHVTLRLAVALQRAREAAPGATAPWRFAMDALWLEGIDPELWLPREEVRG
jgi:hypothetical protein